MNKQELSEKLTAMDKHERAVYHLKRGLEQHLFYLITPLHTDADAPVMWRERLDQADAHELIRQELDRHTYSFNALAEQCSVEDRL